MRKHILMLHLIVLRRVATQVILRQAKLKPLKT